MKDAAQNAITAALAGKWKEAKDINFGIVKEYPKNIDALNRLAKAHYELGEMPSAIKIAKRVLKLDPYNKIAKKSLEKWKGQKKSKKKASSNNHDNSPSTPQAFLEEAGKTKIVNLLNLGSPKVLVELDSGDKVDIVAHSHRVCLNNSGGKYIGRLPDDLSAHLRKLIKHGNEYEAFVKSVGKGIVKVFLRETKRSDKLKHVASFSSEKINYVAFTPPELVRAKETLVGEE